MRISNSIKLSSLKDNLNYNKVLNKLNIEICFENIPTFIDSINNSLNEF